MRSLKFTVAVLVVLAFAALTFVTLEVLLSALYVLLGSGG